MDIEMLFGKFWFFQTYQKTKEPFKSLRIDMLDSVPEQLLNYKGVLISRSSIELQPPPRCRYR